MKIGIIGLSDKRHIIYTLVRILGGLSTTVIFTPNKQYLYMSEDMMQDFELNDIRIVVYDCDIDEITEEEFELSTYEFIIYDILTYIPNELDVALILDNREKYIESLEDNGLEDISIFTAEGFSSSDALFDEKQIKVPHASLIEPALLRAGRFDKHIYVGLPSTKEDREAIVAKHLENKTLADGLTIEKVSSYLVGLSGAEIAGVINDALLLSFREEGKEDAKGVITEELLDTAFMTLVAKGVLSNRNNAEEDKLIAYHEAGHTVVSLSLNKKINKVTILPYGMSGGSTLENHDVVSTIKTKSMLLNQVKVLYGGLLSEEHFFGEHSSGCSNDLKVATSLIEQCVEHFSMSESMALLSKSEHSITDDFFSSKVELSKSLKEDTRDIINANKDYIEKLANRLLAEQTVYNLNSLSDI